MIQLWDAWDDDAFVGDKRTGVWADPAKRASAPTTRASSSTVVELPAVPAVAAGASVLLAQAGSSPAGVALAAKYADGVFTPQRDIAAGQAFRARLREQAQTADAIHDHVRALPGLSFVLGSTEAEARARSQALEDAASGEFRWRNLANLAGLDFRIRSIPTRRSRRSCSRPPRR